MTKIAANDKESVAAQYGGFSLCFFPAHDLLR